jgi:hypothetical protein
MNAVLRTLANEAKKPLVLDKSASVDTTAERLVFDWAVELGNHGHEPLPHENLFAYQTFKLWQQTGVLELPVIVGATPGFGKSTMLSVYLRYMVRKHPDTFGAIVVKERIDDLRSLADEINLEDKGGGVQIRHNFAYFIEGFDEQRMTREHYEEQFTTQAQYNVVIMTTKQFELQALKDNLSAFSRFKDSRGMNRPRRTLLIDEKPALVISQRLTFEQLNKLRSDIMQASFEATGSRQSYVGKTLEVINELSRIIEETEDVGRFPLNPIKRKYMLPRKLLANFGDVFGVEELQTLRAFERVIGYGGEISSANGRIEVISTYYLHYDITEFNTFIMDGTGDIDPEYIGRDFNLFMPTIKPDLSNVTFHICNKYGMSKTSIKTHADTLKNIAGEIKEIVAGLEGTTLVVTNKEFIADLEELVPSSEYAVVYKHYDGGRGSNDFADINNAIYIGVLNKGSAYYSTAAQAVIGDRSGEVLDIHQSKVGGRYEFNDDRVEEYKSLDIAVGMVQETHRLRSNKKDNDVNIYVFYNDERTISHITEAYEGSTVKEYVPIKKLVGTRTTADDIIDYFTAMPAGEEVKGSRIYKELGVDGSTFRKAVGTERVKTAMSKLGVKKVKTKFVKEAM